MKSTLRISLKSGERIFINGAVLRVDRKVAVEFLNDVTFLLENHVLQPLVYSRTVQLSPLAILIAVLIGAKLAGILGALAAIPVAGTIQVLFLAWLAERRGVDTAAEARAGP